MKTFTDGFFSIDPINGFLPVKEPLLILPKKYALLQNLIDEMPIKNRERPKGLSSKENAVEEATLMHTTSV